MKVVHVTHRYPPAIGGAEVWLREIAGRSARDHGLQVEVHALALHTYTAAEWQAREQAAPASPECHGGSKSAQG